MKDILDMNNLKAQIIFADQTQEEESFHQNDLVRLFPYGLSVNGDASRPFLLLKDEGHQYTLPVAVSAIEAGVSLAQTNRSTVSSSPHKFTELLLQSMGVEIMQAVFVEIKGSSQFMRLYLSGNPKLSSLKLRADEAMSLCLYLQVPLFATKSFIGKSRVMTAEMEVPGQKFPLIGNIDRNNGGYLN
jgi:bifunctional DNase/RNase